MHACIDGCLNGQVDGQEEGKAACVVSGLPPHYEKGGKTKTEGNVGNLSSRTYKYSK